jgi:hypothetical protein
MGIGARERCAGDTSCRSIRDAKQRKRIYLRQIQNVQFELNEINKRIKIARKSERAQGKGHRAKGEGQRAEGKGHRAENSVGQASRLSIAPQ